MTIKYNSKAIIVEFAQFSNTRGYMNLSKASDSRQQLYLLYVQYAEWQGL